MTYIKKLVIYGFKSFVRKTELPFSRGRNIIIGPNGSGKSNISDALCFVLGRLSTKSMRATKTKNLIFLGSKNVSPLKEASVEIIFDNSNKVFPVDEKELKIKRIVRKDGQSIYKINDKRRKRQETLEMLAYAGIYPDSFNIILQGKIQHFVEMPPEERKKIIEDVSGVSIYEMRKEKSLRELKKVDEKLKEVSSILRERSSYLNTLEKDRREALRFKKLEGLIRIYQASILSEKTKQRKEEEEEIKESISKLKENLEEQKKRVEEDESSIEEFNSKVSKIVSFIKNSTGFEQEKINREIVNLRAEIAGVQVKKEEKENRILKIRDESKRTEGFIYQTSQKIKEFQKKSPTTKVREEQKKELERKRKELELLESSKKNFYTFSSEFNFVKRNIEDEKNSIEQTEFNLEKLSEEINKLYLGLTYKNSSEEEIKNIKSSLEEDEKTKDFLYKKLRDLEKVSYSSEKEIEKQKEIIEKISEFDVCPLCKSEITENHINSIKKEVEPKINYLNKKIINSDKEASIVENTLRVLKQKLLDNKIMLEKKEKDFIILNKIKEGKRNLEEEKNKIERSRKNKKSLENKRKEFEEKLSQIEDVEEKYDEVKLEVEELSVRLKQELNFEFLSKQSEVDRGKILIKKYSREREALKEELKEIEIHLKEIQLILSKKRLKEESLREEFKEKISEKETIQKEIRTKEIQILKTQSEMKVNELNLNNFKINLARVIARIETLEYEFRELESKETIKMSLDKLENKLKEVKEALSKIGNVNLRSLEVYEKIKEEYNSVNEKSETILKEKGGILKIIKEIDIKKKKKFLETMKNLNVSFSKNFLGLSEKGKVSLELEEKKDPFNSGINIILKTMQGKLFDVTSLSGGEQTLVAISLIFAIQELTPYYFYLLDEIDASLDRENTERLSELLKNYMKSGQYIIITHNDALILKSDNVYGVTMNDGLSKVISLKL